MIPVLITHRDTFFLLFMGGISSSPFGAEVSFCVLFLFIVAL